ncbi:Hypothetical predicted protein [Podarcis lilfordi]|uniref:Uncharacterized protein n=1 Tax=Podarcis lilfordi TaxID=74358 RepID=A0AA35PAG4_9SAUR|nr:Hypothetical predicted protein [Podarcis lilfordi]
MSLRSCWCPCSKSVTQRSPSLAGSAGLLCCKRLKGFSVVRCTFQGTPTRSREEDPEVGPGGMDAMCPQQPQTLFSFYFYFEKSKSPVLLEIKLSSKMCRFPFYTLSVRRANLAASAFQGF